MAKQILSVESNCSSTSTNPLGLVLGGCFLPLLLASKLLEILAMNSTQLACDLTCGRPSVEGMLLVADMIAISRGVICETLPPIIIYPNSCKLASSGLLVVLAGLNLP